MDIKAIETTYNGVRFRSRTEARWAVFFDAAGIEWEYEPEGFELAGGIRYLPDFSITFSGSTSYVEVKPTGDEAWAMDLSGGPFAKAFAFAKQSRQEILLLEGPPSELNASLVIVFTDKQGRCVRESRNWHDWEVYFYESAATARAHRFWDPVT